MKLFFTGSLFISLLISLSAYSQPAVSVYADVEQSDTLKKLVTILSSQLQKSQRLTIRIAAAANFNGRGVYIATVGKGRQKVIVPAALRRSGIEAFSIKADGAGVQIIGNSDMATGHGIFTWLESLGYRFYFPNPDWHIVPAQLNLYAKLTIISQPAFDHRKIWYGYGTGSKVADDDYNFWTLANKMGGAMNAYFGHSYGNIIARNRDAFAQHPEWFYPPAAKGTVPADGKFDMSNEGLVQLVIKDAESQIEASLKNKTAAYKMISLGPSDGNGTCNTPACQKLGTVTDRVYYLVNRVAKAIRNKYPSTLVGSLAYVEYSEPPTIKLEPNVFVAITTAFNSSSYTTDQLIQKWRSKGAIVGIYDYFSWYAWDFDIPGQSQVSKISALLKQIRKYHSLNVKAYDAESSIGWISKGLGYYMASHAMWDVNTDENKIRKEFFSQCFGKASVPMIRLWNEWENYSSGNVRESNLAGWIDLVTNAEKLERDEKVQRRLMQVKSYLHYLCLYRIYMLDKSEANLLSLLNYGYRKLDEGSVSGYPAFFELGARSGIAKMGWSADAKWRYNNTPVTIQEMNRWIAEDRKGLTVAQTVKAFTPVASFTNVPDASKFLRIYGDGPGINNSFWINQEFVFEIRKKNGANYIELSGDFVADPNNKKPIRLTVYPYDVSGDFSGKQALLTYSYTARQVKEQISLAGLAPGFYSLMVEDPTKIFKISFSEPVNYSAIGRPSRQIQARVLDYAFIYVPEGVRFFNAIKARTLEFVTPSGRQIKYMTDKPEDVQVEVKKGESGIWKIKVLDRLYLEGIPPFIGLSLRQMLIPKQPY